MKKLLFAVVALFVLAPFAGFAEPTHPNEIGLYTTPDGNGATGTNEIGVIVDVFLVLTKPEANNAPCSGILAFECQLNFNPFGWNIFLIGHELNGNGLNIGDVDHINSYGFLEFIVGFANPGVPSINDAVLLVSFEFMNIYEVGPVEVTLGPPSVQTIPGQMGFLSSTHYFEAMYSMGGAMDAPVFIFGGEAVLVENESFGSVKALYR